VDHVFLDANVLFSAAYRTDSGLLRLWKLAGVELLSSDYAIQEARVNLFEREQLARLDKLLANVRAANSLAALPDGIDLAEKDRPILQAAIAAHASHLLTGDKRDFGAFFGKRIAGVLILPPSEYFARRLRQ
jgi:predicted nucleic acid-binding protein